MLLDDGQRFIKKSRLSLNESFDDLTPEQQNQLDSLMDRYEALLSQAERNLSILIDDSPIQTILSAATDDLLNFPLDADGFRKLYDFHDELYKNTILGAYKETIIDMIFFASKFANMVGLEPNSRDMKLLSDYLVDNLGLLAKVETDPIAMVDKVKANLKISEARQTFEYEDREDPVDIAKSLLNQLRDTHSVDDLQRLASMLSSGAASPTTLSPSPESDASSLKDIEDYEQVQAAVEKYQRSFFDAMYDTFIKRAAVIVNNEGQFKKFFSNPKFFNENHGESLESFKQHFNFKSPDYNKANDFFESIGLTNDTAVVQRHALELANALQIEKLSESQEPKKEVVGIKFDLNKCKELAQLNESFLALFGGWAKYLMQAMFGDLNIPVQVTGTQREIESLAKALRTEQGYLNLVSKYGLDDERTYSSKSRLDKAASNFEKETGLKWPFA